MKGNEVTKPGGPEVTPVVYIDVDIVPATEDEVADEITAAEMCQITAYPGLQALLIAEHGPGGGNPVYRVEGPLPQLVKWVFDRHDSGDVQENLNVIACAKLAR